MMQSVLEKSLLRHRIAKLILIAIFANHVVLFCSGQFQQDQFSRIFNQNYNRAYNNAIQAFKPQTASQRLNIGPAPYTETPKNQLRPQNSINNLAQLSQFAAYSSPLNNPVQSPFALNNRPSSPNNLATQIPNQLNSPLNSWPSSNFAQRSLPISNPVQPASNAMFNGNLNRQTNFQSGNNLLNTFTGAFNNAFNNIMNPLQQASVNAMNGFNNPFKNTVPFQSGFQPNQFNIRGGAVIRPPVLGAGPSRGPVPTFPFPPPNPGLTNSGIPNLGAQNRGMAPRGMTVGGPFRGMARGNQVINNGIFSNGNLVGVPPISGRVDTSFIRPGLGISPANVGLLQGGNIGTASLGINTGLAPHGTVYIHNNTGIPADLSLQVTDSKNSSLEASATLNSPAGTNLPGVLGSSTKISNISSIVDSSSLASLLKSLTDKSALLTDDGSSLRNYLVKINSTESDITKWDSILKEKEKDGKLNATSWAKVDPFCSCNDIIACNCCLTLDLAVINKRVCLEANIGKSGNGTKLAIILDKQRQDVTQTTGKQETVKFDIDGLGKGDLEITIPEEQNQDKHSFCGTASLTVLGLAFPALPLGCFSYTNDTITSIK